MKLKITSLLLLFLFTITCSQNKTETLHVLTGADVLISENINLLKGKNLGIITNQTGVLKNGTHLVDTLFSINGIKIKALFGSEHGFTGNYSDGVTLKDTTDSRNIKIFSIYGKTKKPTAEMLKNIDLLIFDIQDIGARFYTFISTMFYCLEAAAENNIPIIVLDRPNLINGINVDGPVIDEDLISFVGIAPIPIVHGMTNGELALLFNDEQMLSNGVKADLKIIKMKNWKREYFFDETKLPWIPTSPNIPNLETAIIYPGACLLEGTNISEGRGTDTPFLLFGAPFLDSEKVIYKLNNSGIKGASFKKEDFVPVNIPGRAINPKFENKKCGGIKVTITNRNEFNSVEFGVKLLSIIHEIHKGDFKWKSYINNLFGKKYLKEMIANGRTAEEIINKWKDEVREFKSLRNKYLLY